MLSLPITVTPRAYNELRGCAPCGLGGDKMEIKPLGDRIVVKPLEAENKSKGGIVLPDTAKEKPQEAKVVAVRIVTK